MVLTWLPGEGSPPDVLYTVRYQRYGDEDWLQKSECQNITQPFCNLTHETENFRERYYARVRAVIQNCCSSDWVPSQRFYPREDSKGHGWSLLTPHLITVGSVLFSLMSTATCPLASVLQDKAHYGKRLVGVPPLKETVMPDRKEFD
ncbi:Interleukin-22 receptor subunit alpha-1 [Chelonia mydas]|uniref:Interleukin-22 receptor subunit alpha-1 n=1 Tax=Chelonia mydas TaxID=8469 RepID=M7ARR6_CHEMY|nr:Interleukin-22 receptor subunit alpha-1 [Chelonia mydas]